VLYFGVFTVISAHDIRKSYAGLNFPEHDRSISEAAFI